MLTNYGITPSLTLLKQVTECDAVEESANEYGLANEDFTAIAEEAIPTGCSKALSCALLDVEGNLITYSHSLLVYLHHSRPFHTLTLLSLNSFILTYPFQTPPLPLPLPFPGSKPQLNLLPPSPAITGHDINGISLINHHPIEKCLFIFTFIHQHFMQPLNNSTSLSIYQTLQSSTQPPHSPSHRLPLPELNSLPPPGRPDSVPVFIRLSLGHSVFRRPDNRMTRPLVGPVHVPRLPTTSPHSLRPNGRLELATLAGDGITAGAVESCTVSIRPHLPTSCPRARRRAQPDAGLEPTAHPMLSSKMVTDASEPAEHIFSPPVRCRLPVATAARCQSAELRVSSLSPGSMFQAPSGARDTVCTDAGPEPASAAMLRPGKPKPKTFFSVAKFPTSGLRVGPYHRSGQQPPQQQRQLQLNHSYPHRSYYSSSGLGPGLLRVASRPHHTPPPKDTTMASGLAAAHRRRKQCRPRRAAASKGKC
ncbi:unnamed protein product [Protopolystoma xenopodis]|uniref:Uncharacterized protein n=1 Tax=Protopolystoma xenopodis TaxID=117903 RepID=A0A3S4ZXJ3_9PLAT|nr:unnamed protein product [Protopolystoma xenopodis]